MAVSNFIFWITVIPHASLAGVQDSLDLYFNFLNLFEI